MNEIECFGGCLDGDTMIDLDFPMDTRIVIVVNGVGFHGDVSKAHEETYVKSMLTSGVSMWVESNVRLGIIRRWCCR